MAIKLEPPFNFEPIPETLHSIRIEADALQGNVNRMFITESKQELDSRFHYAQNNLIKIYNFHNQKFFEQGSAFQNKDENIVVFSNEDCKERARKAISLSERLIEIKRELKKTEDFLNDITDSNFSTSDLNYIGSLIDNRIQAEKEEQKVIEEELSLLI
jgi:hypothetical protein